MYKIINKNDIIKILCDNKKKGIYNIGSGEAINLKKIAEIIARKFKKTIFFLRDNKPTYLISNSSKLKKLGWLKSTAELFP